jgi:GLPGLI family protein
MKTLKYLLGLGLIAGLFTAKAQEKPVTVIYQIEVEAPEGTGAAQSDQMMNMFKGSKMTMYFENGKSRVEMAMGPMQSIAIVDANKNQGITLVETMGMKQALTMGEKVIAKAEEMQKSTGLNVEKTGESKEIAGYSCQQAIISGENQPEVELWYTDEIDISNAYSQYSYGDIKGMPLEMYVNQGGMKLHMLATEVNRDAIPEGSFDLTVPEGYQVKEMSPSDL